MEGKWFAFLVYLDGKGDDDATGLLVQQTQRSSYVLVFAIQLDCGDAF